jgi:type I restriction enzyme S subunit
MEKREMRRTIAKRKWPQKRLCEIAEVVKGRKPDNFTAVGSSVTVPYLEATFLRGQSEPKHISLKDADGLVLVDATDTQILWDGANAGDIFCGKTGVVASTMARVRAQTNEILPEFLHFCIMMFSSELRETATGSTVPHVRGKVVDDLQISLPPIPVQERIVQIFQKADEIRRKRQEALKLADAILSASFIGMFGDPGNNHNDFERLPLGQVADVRSGVTKGRKLHGKETIEVPYLRVANVQDGFLDLSEVKSIEVLPDDVDKYHLEDGDILMTEGGDPDKLGRGTVWRNQVEGCIHQNHVFRVRTNREKLTPEYLAALLRTQYAKHYFLSCAKRSSNLASVNSTQVKAFLILLPPIKLQEKFVSAVEQWVQTSEKLTSALKDASKLLESAMNKTFTGELTAEWEAANAEWIARQVELQERLPRLLLLALIREKVLRVEKVAQAAVLVTALMKYAFLIQMEGQSRQRRDRRFYNFVPYHYGPFAKEVYADLEKLHQEGLIRVRGTGWGTGETGASEILMAAEEQAPYGDESRRQTESNRIEIGLNHVENAERSLADLPDDLKEDVAAIIDTYGDFDHNALLKTVYEKYPAYAKKSRLRGKREKT